MSTIFFKSTYSGGNGSCVEVAHMSSSVLIRDSKYSGPVAEQPTVRIQAGCWNDFLDLVLSANSGVLDGVAIAVQPSGGATVTQGNNVLVYTADEWDAFAKGVADGEFDRR
ncbi:DUF397 domain-containing protein [Nocardia sp. NPDC059195]|uniref:DUF397 domain-containing protein n=1 Tax=Nocardia sp. NPDC059195 TaxID=3346765 RepID=UPI00369B1658